LDKIKSKLRRNLGKLDKIWANFMVCPHWQGGGGQFLAIFADDFYGRSLNLKHLNRFSFSKSIKKSMIANN